MSTEPKRTKRLTARPTPVRFDEANLGRLGLISILERIPEDAHKWEVHFEVEGRPARIACIGTPEFGGYPHGLDNDISGALINLYIEAGAPADGWFHTTAYRILQRAGLQTSGRYYEILRASLMRLRSTTYFITDSWFDTRRHHITASFNYIEKLEYTSADDDLKLSSGSVLRVRLAPEITASIRARYLRPLDDLILSRLNGPQARALYRLLEGRRVDPFQAGEVLGEFTSPLRDWAQACKILETKPARIKRNLEAPHRSLLDVGYLLDVEYGGSARAQTITYRFKGAELTDTSELAMDADLLRKFTRHGVSAKVAGDVLARLGEDRVRERIRKYELILASGYTAKNPSGLLLDVIRDDTGKYPDPPGFHAADRHPPAATPTADDQPAVEQTEALLRQQPLEARIDACLHTLQGLLGRHMTTRDFAVLREKLSVGLAEPVDLGKQAVQATFQGKQDAFLKDLQRFLSQ